MFLDELRQRFTDGYHDTAKLKKLRADMGLMRFLDPAVMRKSDVSRDSESSAPRQFYLAA
jgi:hypothetical protein